MVKMHDEVKGEGGGRAFALLAYLWRRVKVENDRFWPSTFDHGTVESAFKVRKLDGSSAFFLQLDNVFRDVVHV
jgi:hypothetical protein